MIVTDGPTERHDDLPHLVTGQFLNHFLALTSIGNRLCRSNGAGWFRAR